MSIQEEIKKKYQMFRTVKKMVILMAIISVVNLFMNRLLSHYGFTAGSALFLALSVLTLALFLLLWFSIFPMKKHILSLIERHERLQP